MSLENETPTNAYKLMPEERWMVARMFAQAQESTARGETLQRLQKLWGPQAFVLYCAGQGDRFVVALVGLFGATLLAAPRTEGAVGLSGYIVMGAALLLGTFMFVRLSQRRQETRDYKARQEDA